MVQQYQSPVRVYKHPFELVMAAYEKRFPTCKMIPIFAGSEITFESRSDDAARHVVERRCKLLVDAPYLVKKIIGVEHVYFIQKNTLDRRARTLHIEAHNESFSSRIVIVETCKYYVHPENSSWTCFEQTASLDVKSFFGFENAIEKVAIKQYSTNIKKGKEVIEFYIGELISQGVDYIAPFSESNAYTEQHKDVDNNCHSTIDATADIHADADADVTIGSSADVDSESRRGSRTQAAVLDFDCSDGVLALERQDCASAIAAHSVAGRSQSIASTSATSNTLLATSDTTWASCNEAVNRSRASLNGETPAQSASNSIFDVRPADRSTGTISGASVSRLAATATSISGGSSASTLGDSSSPQASAPQSALLQSQSTESAAKLDDVYIQRYLGALTPLEESRLLQLRDAMRRACATRDPLPSDATMLRFLRARSCNVEKAREMLSRSLSWRRRHAIDSLLSAYEPADVLARHFAGGWHYFDKSDRPLYLLRLGALDVKGLLKSVGEERVLRHILFTCEQAVAKLRSATHVRGHPVAACTVVVDLDGLGMRHLWRPGIRALLRILEHLEAHYPEMLHRVLVVRAPRIFPILWTLVSPFIDENTRQKFVVYSGREHVGPHGLAQFIDRQYLPVDLAGECEWCDVPDGGLVPKSAYRFEHDAWTWPTEPCGTAASPSSSDDDPDTNSPAPSSLPCSGRTLAVGSLMGPPTGLDAVYRTVNLATASNYAGASADAQRRFEVRYRVALAGAVVTWDFEVLSGDVQFEIFSLPLTDADAESDAAPVPLAVPPLSKQSRAATGHSAGRCSAATVSDDSIVSLSLSAASTASPSFSMSTNSSGYMTGSGPAPSSLPLPPSVVSADLRAFETAQTFKYGASVQGSHITTRAAQYVLRWTAVACAAKLSYYTELVSRAQFHGSLSSLRSCRSSVCSLDATSARPIRPSPLAEPVADRPDEQHTVTFHI